MKIHLQHRDKYRKVAVNDETERKSTRMLILAHVFWKKHGTVSPIPHDTELQTSFGT